MAAVSVKRSIIFISMNYFFYSSTNIFSLRFTSKYAYIIFRILFSVSNKTTTKRVVEINSTQKDLHNNISISLFFIISLFNNILIFTVYITI